MTNNTHFTAYLLKNNTQYDWWPYRNLANSMPDVDSLWLPVEAQSEPDLLNYIADACAQLTWFGMGTWFTNKDSPQDISERFPGLTRERISIIRHETPKGMSSTTEWCTLNPASKNLHGFMTRIRKSRSKGWAIGLATSEQLYSAWSSLSAGLWWRSILALDASYSADVGHINDTISSLYISQSINSGIMPVIPLDYHPSGGYVIFGNSEQLYTITRNIPRDSISQSTLVVDSIWDAGGGLSI